MGIMQCLPALAATRTVVGPVLKLLSALAIDPALSATAIREQGALHFLDPRVASYARDRRLYAGDTH
jgi:hypothetical protein